MVSRIKYYIDRLLRNRPRVIWDSSNNKRLGDFQNWNIAYRADIVKEELSRRYVMGVPGSGLKFLDAGGKDGTLTYLLGIRQNLEFDQAFYEENKQAFYSKFEYYGMDLRPVGNGNILAGDMCSTNFLADHKTFVEFFDVIYSNNVFEHLRKPWVAAENLTLMLKPGGIVITVVPFAQRYHQDPEDFFRYTHKGAASLFEDCADYEVLEAGYDTCGRRNNWQGSGETNDIVPVDNFGAWRETWFTVVILRKRIK
jgi:SAM-dependent methyltransferase